ncbi:hypothetical protein MASR2M29_02360 [Spirochaetota bacterium]
MPTQAEIDRGRGIMIGGFLDGRILSGGNLYEVKQDDYPAYVSKLKEEFPVLIDRLKQKINENLKPDTSPSIKTNNFVEPAYKVLYKTIKDFDWDSTMINAVAIYKIIGDRTMGNIAFDGYLKLVYRYILSMALPKPDVATYADGAYLANQVLTDKFEGLFYHSEVGDNQLYNYAKALQDELKDDGFDLDKTACQSSLFSTFGTGYDLMFLHVNPFEHFDRLWEEQ